MTNASRQPRRNKACGRREHRIQCVPIRRMTRSVGNFELEIDLL